MGAPPLDAMSFIASASPRATPTSSPLPSSFAPNAAPPDIRRHRYRILPSKLCGDPALNRRRVPHPCPPTPASPPPLPRGATTPAHTPCQHRRRCTRGRSMAGTRRRCHSAPTARRAPHTRTAGLGTPCPRPRHRHRWCLCLLVLLHLDGVEVDGRHDRLRASWGLMARGEEWRWGGDMAH